ncbi:hypothetical protein ABW21_db0200819 [Orbilia brochopaga]|nr:hypothetical protein ABW21_db0200819 [Drechslerella brochopaga]
MTGKVPFLLWFGSPESYLSLTTAKYFFEDADTDRSQIDVFVDDDPFNFNVFPNEDGTNYVSILGRDFLDSRFREIEADYTTFKITCHRRRQIRDSQAVGTLDWVRERDRELERYLQMDDGMERADDDDPAIELVEDDNGGDAEQLGEITDANTVGDEMDLDLAPDGPTELIAAEKANDVVMAENEVDDEVDGTQRGRTLRRVGNMGPPAVSASGRVVGSSKEGLRTRLVSTSLFSIPI